MSTPRFTEKTLLRRHIVQPILEYGWIIWIRISSSSSGRWEKEDDKEAPSAETSVPDMIGFDEICLAARFALAVFFVDCLLPFLIGTSLSSIGPVDRPASQAFSHVGHKNRS
jgi:hypothetical protein